MIKSGTIVIDDRDIEERFVHPSPNSLMDLIAGHRVTADGVLLIDSREHRTQAQNRAAARARLIALVGLAAKRPRRRRPTKPRAGAREKRLASKKQRSALKAARSGGRRGEE